MLTRFILYLACGWSIEIVWTGTYALLKGNRTAMGHTSLWMGAVYLTGGILMERLHLIAASGWFLPLAALAHVVVIYTVEYSFGRLFQVALGELPWSYPPDRWTVHGVIRLSYAPAWWLVGCLFELLHRYVLKH